MKYMNSQEFTTTNDFSSSIISKKFDDPNEYIYQSYLETNENDANDFLEYRENWKASQEFTKEFDFPLYILTELTFSCNYRCPQCILGDKDETKKFKPETPQMSMELFRKITNEGEKHGCKSLCLNHTNEPLLVKDLTDRIHYAREHGFVDILMNTNGELLTQELSGKLIKSGLTRLMVSIDANSSDTFKKIRVGGDFDLVRKNTLNFIKIRNQMGLKLPLVRTSFVLQAGNKFELEAFEDYWKDRVDYVHIQRFSKPYDTADDSRISNKNLKSEKIFRCDQPNNRIVIRSDGQVLPCCSWYSYEIPVGNINDSSIYEIWNAKPMKDLRRIHYDGNYQLNETCKKCVGSINF